MTVICGTLQTVPFNAVRFARRHLDQLMLFEWVRPPEVAPTPAARSLAGRGIDITAKAGDIRKIVFAKFRVEALDRDDLLQEVLFTIHRRNSLPSAFDPARAEFSTYVCMVARNVISHMLEAPRWRTEAAEEADAEPTGTCETVGAQELGEDLDVDVDASRALGEIVPRCPRQVWEIALEQRRAAQSQPPAPEAASADDVPGRDTVADEDQPPSARRHRGRGRAVDRIAARSGHGNGRGRRADVLHGDALAAVG